MNQIVQFEFDYNKLPPESAKLARAAAARIRRNSGRLVSTCIEIGRDLDAIKSRLQHGYFGNWISQELGMTQRTAQNYLQLFRAFGTKCETVSHLPVKLAYLLSSPSTPKSTVSAILSELESSDQPDYQAIESRVIEDRKSAVDRNRETRTYNRTENNSREDPYADFAKWAKVAGFLVSKLSVEEIENLRKVFIDIRDPIWTSFLDIGCMEGSEGYEIFFDQE